MNDAPESEAPSTPKPVPIPTNTTSHASDLSQLLFIVGHIASKIHPHTLAIVETLTHSP